MHLGQPLRARPKPGSTCRGHGHNMGEVAASSHAMSGGTGTPPPSGCALHAACAATKCALDHTRRRTGERLTIGRASDVFSRARRPRYQRVKNREDQRNATQELLDNSPRVRQVAEANRTQSFTRGSRVLRSPPRAHASGGSAHLARASTGTKGKLPTALCQTTPRASNFEFSRGDGPADNRQRWRR